ncbi:MAG TPA: UbiA family prenyltransferase [Thermoplasmata archaeon]|nr:UbiA family prenyltransferase [Thermoplasmata archaeon]
MRGLLALSRPLNCLMSAAGVLIGTVAAGGVGAWSSAPLSIGLAGLAAALFTAGGNAMNDLFDVETDRINHPERPLASGTVSPRTARTFTILLFAGSSVAAVFVSVANLAIVLLNAGVMYGYERRWKSQGLPGNLAISYLVGSLFLFAAVAVYSGPVAPMIRGTVLAALASFATAGREITKDIEDMKGDVDRRTLPQRVGALNAGFAAAGFLVIAVGLSLFPAYFGVLGLGYLVVVLLADGMFIYAALHSAANPSRSQRVTKYAMIVALAAFLAGAFV